MTTEFGKRILKKTLEKGITLKDIATGIGMSDAEISYIVRGKRKSQDVQKRIEEYVDNLADNCKISEYEKEIRFKLIDADIPVSQLAKQLGISRAAAYYAITNKRGYDKIRERIEEMLA